MTAEDAVTPQPHVPTGAIAHASAAISALFGHPRQSLLLYAFVLAILIAPFTGWTNFRLVLWCLVAMGIAWIQMAVNRNTGGSIHHTILLWPLPQAIVALSFARIPRRAALALTAVVALSGALVVNEYYSELVRNGGAPAWDDAVFPMAQYLDRAAPYDTAFAMDWGIIEPVRLLDHGRVRLAVGTDPQPEPELRAMVADPRNLFIAHPAGAEFFKGKNEELEAFAAKIGFVPQVVARFPDRYGRPFFEIYRFLPDLHHP
jgi:hypothetical protein